MTRLLGPGCPPAPAHIPVAAERMGLTHAVILHDGEPVWVLDAGDLLHDQRPGEYRPARWQLVMPGEPIRLDCGCRAGRACRDHDRADALRWWTEAHRRDAVREWRPELEAGVRLPYDAERPVCVTPEHAEREARRLGRTHIVCRDGWHREIERLEVGRG